METEVRVKAKECARMRISLVFLGSTGAGPVYAYEMARALLTDKRCQLQVIVSENVANLPSWEKAFAGGNADFHVVKTYNRSKLSVFLNTFNIVRKYRIYKLIRDFQPDVLYSPFVLMWERFLFGMMHGKTHVVKTIHDVKLHDSYRTPSDFFTYILNYGSMRYVDSIVLLNHKDVPLVEKRYHKPIVVIPHACFDYYFRHPESNKGLRNTIGFIGRIEPYKGIDLLIDAFERLKSRDVKLLIAGSGDIESGLAERIKKNQRIELVNRYIDDAEMQSFIERADFFVLPYKRASQSGVIPMCFAGGKTVIATNVGALSEQVPEGTGLIVPPDAEKIAEAIDFLYDHPALIAQYGKAAHSYATTQLTWNHSAQQLLEFLSSTIR